jgi:predicted dehydrogenase
MNLRVGVIGTGMMGQRHCRVYSTLRRAQLVGVCDANPASGNRVARQYDVTFYESLEDLLTNVDAVTLATPTPSHFDLAMRCLDHGVHVLIEKPVTETLEQAEKLAQAAEASGLVVQVGHIERFNPTYIELKHVLEGMTLLAVDLRRLSPYEGSNKDVDVVLDLMIHDIDLALDLMGQEPTSVAAYGLTAYSGGAIDHVTAQLGFDSGPLLTMTASRVTEQKVRSINVTAKKAYVEGDLLNKSISVHRRTVGEYLSQNNHQGIKYRQESIVERISVPMAEPLLLELQSFAESILENKPSSIPARDGLKTLRLSTLIQNTIYERLNGVNEPGGSKGGSKAAKSGAVEPALAAAA